MAKTNKRTIGVRETSGVKKLRSRLLTTHDAAAIDDAPINKRAKKRPKATSRKVDIDEGVDQRRVSPHWLVDAMGTMNPLQRQAVEHLGFGHLFHLKLDYLPPKMVSWCLDRFQGVSCSFVFPKKKLIHIDTEDVFLIFGFPRGNIRIDTNSRTQDKDLIEEWSAMFGKSRHQILPSDVVSVMLSNVDGGVWFKRLFLILVEACLFENAADGYVKPKIFNIIRDLSKIPQQDWCDHMITSLLRTHEKWLSSSNRTFTGPSIFLVLFYVDRLVRFKRDVVRTFPLMKGWTTEALRARQRDEVEHDNVGFGHGFLDIRFVPLTNLINNNDATNMPMGAEPLSADLSRLEGYTHNLMYAAKRVAESMSELMNLINKAPTNIRQNVVYNKVIQISIALIGLKIPTIGESSEEKTNLKLKMMATDWGSKDWQTAIVRIMEVYEERELLQSKLGDPSFNLGFTQVLESPQKNDTQHEKDVCRMGEFADAELDADKGFVDNPFVADGDAPDTPFDAEILPIPPHHTVEVASVLIGDILKNSNDESMLEDVVEPNHSAVGSLKDEGACEIDGEEITKLRKKCEKRMKKLMRKQREQTQELLQIWEDKKAELERDWKLRLAVIRSMHGQTSAGIDKLKVLNDDFKKEIDDHDILKNVQLENLEAEQLTAINGERQRAADWIAKAKAKAIVSPDRCDILPQKDLDAVGEENPSALQIEIATLESPVTDNTVTPEPYASNNAPDDESFVQLQSVDVSPSFNQSNHDQGRRSLQMPEPEGAEVLHESVSQTEENSAPSLLPDPLQIDLEKKHKEAEQMDKIHADMMAQLKSDCEKEIEDITCQIRNRYEIKYKDSEAEFRLKKNQHDKNQCLETRPPGSPVIHQGIPSFMLLPLVRPSLGSPVTQSPHSRLITTRAVRTAPQLPRSQSMRSISHHLQPSRPTAGAPVMPNTPSPAPQLRPIQISPSSTFRSLEQPAMESLGNAERSSNRAPSAEPDVVCLTDDE